MALHPDVLALLDRVDAVSLDVFDTAIHRAVLDPADVFLLVPERVPALADAAGPADAGRRYRGLRTRAEADARRRTVTGEVGAKEIVAQLAVALGSRPLAEEAWHAELELELALVRPSEPGRELADDVLRRGLQLFYLSDMYLPSSFIGRLLDRAGLPDAPVIVSNEHGVTKAAGGLYGIMVERAGAPVQQVVHVGDDPLADHRGADRAGLATVELARPSRCYRQRLERFPVPRGLDLDDSLNLGVGAPGFVRSETLRLSTATERLEGLGEAVLGPAVAAFTGWVAEHGWAGAPLLFCSRDGMLPLECYERLGRRWGARPARYFEISRRSVAVPALAAGLRETHRELLCGGRRPRTIEQLFARVGLAADVAARGADAVGVERTDVPLPPGRARQQVFDMFRAVADELAAHAAAELTAFGEYWSTTGLGGTSDVVLVDVGWRATVQRALQDCLIILGEPTVVHGRYLALLDHPDLMPGEAQGMYVDGGRPLRHRLGVEAGIPIVEMMFQADHGSVVGYRDGRAVHEAVAERAAGRTVPDAVQRGARRHLEALAGLDRPVHPTASSLQPLLRLLNQPRPQEAADLGCFPHSDGLADDAHAEPILPDAVPWRRLVPTPAGRRFVRSSEWRPALVALTSAPTAARAAYSYGMSGLKLVGALATSRRTRRTLPLRAGEGR